jgi:hypothetical protein
MKFYVRRTSDYKQSRPPCEGAVFTGKASVIDEIPNDPRANEPCRFTVEIEDLDALRDFATKYGRFVVFPCGEDAILEIYDEYRE